MNQYLEIALSIHIFLSILAFLMVSKDISESLNRPISTSMYFNLIIFRAWLVWAMPYFNIKAIMFANHRMNQRRQKD